MESCPDSLIDVDTRAFKLICNQDKGSKDITNQIMLNYKLQGSQ